MDKKSFLIIFSILFFLFLILSTTIYILSLNFLNQPVSENFTTHPFSILTIHYIYSLILSLLSSFSLSLIFSSHKDLSKYNRSTALFDPLTSLLNRRSFMNSLMHESKRAKRNGYNIGLIICDIDDFDKINKKFSRDIGDIILKDISAVIKTTLRRHDLVCRWGIDEFMIMLPETNMEGTRITAEKIRNKISEYTVLIKNYKINTTVSLGTGMYKPEMTHYNEAISYVTEKLIEAKEEGKNNVK